jgi:hypothetical protein
LSIRDESALRADIEQSIWMNLGKRALLRAVAVEAASLD